MQRISHFKNNCTKQNSDNGETYSKFPEYDRKNKTTVIKENVCIVLKNTNWIAIGVWWFRASCWNGKLPRYIRQHHLGSFLAWRLNIFYSFSRFLFLSILLRYKLYTVKHPHLKCTACWVLQVYTPLSPCTLPPAPSDLIPSQSKPLFWTLSLYLLSCVFKLLHWIR